MESGGSNALLMIKAISNIPKTCGWTMDLIALEIELKRTAMALLAKSQSLMPEENIGKTEKLLLSSSMELTETWANLR